MCAMNSQRPLQNLKPEMGRVHSDTHMQTFAYTLLYTQRFSVVDVDSDGS